MPNAVTDQWDMIKMVEKNNKENSKYKLKHFLGPMKDFVKREITVYLKDWEQIK